VKLMVGERFSFKTPQVNLTTPQRRQQIDVLLAAAGSLPTNWISTGTPV